jgi:hypothetical protein
VIHVFALLAFAVVAGTLGASVLQRAQWTARAPRTAVIAWQVLSGAVVLALLLAGVAMVAPDAFADGDVEEMLRVCLHALTDGYATVGDATLHLAGAALAVGLTMRVGAVLLLELHRAGRDARRHLAGIRLAARRDAELDALVVDHPAATAYCLPGRTGTVVLTSGALALLDRAELGAVLAHERAHLRGRHHLVLATARALSRSIPVLPVFARACREQARLLEMTADDAVGPTARRDVARALVHLAEASVPRPALGAADTAALARVRRLVEPAPPLSFAGRAVIAGALLLIAAAPMTIAATSALAVQPDHCPVVVRQALV